MRRAIASLSRRSPIPPSRISRPESSTKVSSPPLDRTNRAYFYRGRHAIYHLIRALHYGPEDVVLVPEYHSGNEVWAIRAAGARVRFYRVRRDLGPDLDQLEELGRSGARARNELARRRGQA